MDEELYNLLRNVSKETNGEEYTHITYCNKEIKWNVLNLKNFWIGYCDIVDRKINDPFANLCIAERQQNIAPQISRLLIQYKSDTNTKCYNDEFLYWLCHIYQTVLLQNFKIVTQNYMELIVVVLETSWYNKEQNLFVNEIRLQFPYARNEIKHQNEIVHPQVIKLLYEYNIINKLIYRPINKWEEIIQPINGPVIMYGSSKLQSHPKLKLTHIWPYITRNMLENKTAPKEIKLEESFSPNNHINVLTKTIGPEIFENKSLQHWIPLFLSIDYWPNALLLKQDKNIKINIIDTKQEIFCSDNKTYEELDNITLAENFISMLDTNRFLNEIYWLDIGKALYSVHQGKISGLNSWIKNTEKVLNNKISNCISKFGDTIEKACSNLYFKFNNNNNITIKTLAWYASKDSPKVYSTWHHNWCISSMEKALSSLHNDVAVAFYRIYWLDFIYCPTGKGKWYEFKNHRWHELNQGIEISKIITTDFMKRFENALKRINDNIYCTINENLKISTEEIIENLSKLIAKLKTVPFKNNIMKELREQFNNENFISLLDSNPNVLGVSNGVLEITSDNVIFRVSKPEDYISMSTNIPYNEYTWDDSLVQECMKWFKQVFTDDKLLHHFLKFSASCLKGRNNDKIFSIWTGEGDNSKSMIVKLFEATFNSYCIKLPVSVLNERSISSNSPTPHLARTKSTRVAFLDEPEDDIPIYKNVIKRLTGGDSFFARFLQENGSEIKTTFKLILTCNRVPVIPNADKAIKNRTKIFPFLSTWVDDAPKEESEQYQQRKFPRDPFFENKIPTLAPAFLWIITQYYSYYIKEGLDDPPIVIEATKAYWNNNDFYSQFIKDTIEIVPNENVRVTLTELYSKFKVWFSNSFPGIKIPERPIFQNEIISKLGKLRNNSWYGIQIKDN